ncbi:hypothetical protein [Streptomyces bluensis]|uniref:hypothetical protein n=1 Tax=Streptomyces bluensis TaxID=33897 RepID=UPI001676046E|nr:hypothetical protein [Streptomyces bluensis]GGZ92983.1 hypothetical protein GCM10010344_70930 [Streptomyces bluensis]
MGEELESVRWSQARAKADTFRGLDGRERDVLALLYYVVAVREGREVASVGLPETRRRLTDLDALQQDLDALLPGPGPDPDRTFEEGQRAQIRRLTADTAGRDGGFTGPGPVTGRIWHVWDCLRTPHGEVADDLMSDMPDHDPPARIQLTGKTWFEQSAGQLVRHVDQLLLAAAGAHLVHSPVQITAGIHAGRTGRINTVIWDTERDLAVGDPPASYRVRLDELYGPQGLVDVSPRELMKLPEWDNKFVVVHAGEILPTEWNAAVLLAADGDTSWHDDAVEALRESQRCYGRQVVLIPRPPDGRAPSAEHDQWISNAHAWADEIIAPDAGVPGEPPRLAPGVPADGREHDGRLIVFPRTPGTELSERSWARQHAVIAEDAVAAARAAQLRIGRGMSRKSGARGVPLLVAQTGGFADWRMRLAEHGRRLVEARVAWADREGGKDRAARWAVHARIEDRELHTTHEVITGHTTRLSIVLYRPRTVWTDSEIVLVQDDTSILNVAPEIGGPHMLLRLPTMDIGLIRSGGTRDRVQAVLSLKFGLSIETDRLFSQWPRNDTSMTASAHQVLGLEITEEELNSLSSSAAERPSPSVRCEIRTLAELMAKPVTDWATLGMITTVMRPTGLTDR